MSGWGSGFAAGCWVTRGLLGDPRRQAAHCFTKDTSYAELDTLHVYRSSALDTQFQVVNRNSGKLLEVLSALTTDGAPVGQWGPTAHPTQRWTLDIVSGTTVQLINVNSGKLLEIPSARMANGVDAVQWAPTGHPT